MMPRRDRRTASALVALVALGVALRLLPWLRDPGIALRDDAAFHERVVRETVVAGRVPALDHLSEAPEGRRLADHLPLGLYAAAAAFHEALAPVDRAPVRTHLILFIALCGALAAVPVFAAARELGAGPGASLLAAFVIATLPAHLHRTFGHWVRYDALGVLLLATHLVFLLRALRGPAPRAADAFLAALALIASACVWRVSLIIPTLEAAWLLIAIATCGIGAAHRAGFAILAVTGSVAFLTLDPMRAQRFAASPGWMFVVLAALAALSPTARPGTTPRIRVITVAVAVAIGVVLARLLPPGAYQSTFELVALKLQRGFGGSTLGTPLARLQLDVVELYALTPLGFLVGPQQFLALGPWFVAAPVLLAPHAWRVPRELARRAASPAALLAFLALACAALTLAFSRNKVLLAPWLAIVIGLVAERLGRAPAAPDRSRRSGAPRRAPSPALRTLALALFGASVLATAVCGVLLATSRHSAYDPELLRLYEFLRTRTPPASIVAAPWWYGYEIQALGERATAMDGLLESPENQRRVLAFHAALLARDPEALRAFCRKQRISHLLVPDPDEITSVAWIVEPGLADEIERGGQASETDRQRIVVRMMRREPVAGFSTAFETNRFRLLAVD